METKEKTSAQQRDMLRMEGIFSEGFGMNPKAVMRDHRLTIEAKAIYSYISSFAGAGVREFPSRTLMIEELGISKDRYYKHFNLLVECDYIRIEKTANGNIHGKNIYVIVSHPDPAGPAVMAETAGNLERSPAPRQKAVKHAPAIHEKSDKIALKEQLGIDDLITQLPEDRIYLEMIYSAVEDIATSEEITIAGSIKKKDAIISLISKLNADNIRSVLFILKNTKQKIYKGKAYIQTCLINSIYTIVAAPVKEDPFIIEQKEKEKAEKKKDEEKKKEYEIFPELIEIDKYISRKNYELSRARLLNKDTDIIKNFERQINDKNIERNRVLQNKNPG